MNFNLRDLDDLDLQELSDQECKAVIGGQSATPAPPPPDPAPDIFSPNPAPEIFCVSGSKICAT